MKTKHTPWRLERFDWHSEVFTDNNEVVFISDGTIDNEQKAQLIAAAPCMLEALEAIDELDLSKLDDETILIVKDFVGAAIRKAKGEES